jgi:hypothetical protein
MSERAPSIGNNAERWVPGELIFLFFYKLVIFVKFDYFILVWYSVWNVLYICSLVCYSKPTTLGDFAQKHFP